MQRDERHAGNAHGRRDQVARCGPAPGHEPPDEGDGEAVAGREEGVLGVFQGEGDVLADAEAHELAAIAQKTEEAYDEARLEQGGAHAAAHPREEGQAQEQACDGEAHGDDPHRVQGAHGQLGDDEVAAPDDGGAHQHQAVEPARALHAGLPCHDVPPNTKIGRQRRPVQNAMERQTGLEPATTSLEG